MNINTILFSFKGKQSHTRNERRVPELIPVFGSQTTGDRSHKPGGRLPLLPARPAFTFPAVEHHRPLAATKLYCLVTEAHVYKQLAQDCTRQRGEAGFLFNRSIFLEITPAEAESP